MQRGQQVAAGQTLVELDTTAARSDLLGALAKEQEAQAESATLGQGGKLSTIASLDDSIASARETIGVAQRHYEALQRLAAQQAATKLRCRTQKTRLRGPTAAAVVGEPKKNLSNQHR